MARTSGSWGAVEPVDALMKDPSVPLPYGSRRRDNTALACPTSGHPTEHSEVLNIKPTPKAIQTRDNIIFATLGLGTHIVRQLALSRNAQDSLGSSINLVLGTRGKLTVVHSDLDISTLVHLRGAYRYN